VSSAEKSALSIADFRLQNGFGVWVEKLRFGVIHIKISPAHWKEGSGETKMG
jgi:hypothetical protein